MSSITILKQVLNIGSECDFVVMATTTIQPTKPVTLKELLGRLELHTIPGIKIFESSQVLQNTLDNAGTNSVAEPRTLQTDMDPADQENLKVMQYRENAQLATVDIVGPKEFGIAIGEGELKHTFKKSGDVLLIGNYAGKEIVKISGDLLLPDRHKKHYLFSQLIPEIRQLILAEAARDEAPREVIIEEYHRKNNYQVSTYFHDVRATAGFKLVCISKTIQNDLIGGGIAQKIQLNNGKSIFFNRDNDILRIQSCAPHYSTRLSLECAMDFKYLKSITLEVNSFLATTRHGIARSLQAMMALQTIIITGEVFTNYGPVDANELVDVNLNFNLIHVSEDGLGNKAKMIPTWTSLDGKIFEDRKILSELESELISEFQGNQASRMNNFLGQLEILFALVTGSSQFTPSCTLVKVEVKF